MAENDVNISILAMRKPLVQIVWEDAHQDPDGAWTGWPPRRPIKCLIRSTGTLIGYENGYVCLAMSCGDGDDDADEYGQVFHIPRGCIVSVNELTLQ